MRTENSRETDSDWKEGRKRRRRRGRQNRRRSRQFADFRFSFFFLVSAGRSLESSMLSLRSGGLGNFSAHTVRSSFPPIIARRSQPMLNSLFLSCLFDFTDAVNLSVPLAKTEGNADIFRPWWVSSFSLCLLPRSPRTNRVGALLLLSSLPGLTSTNLLLESSCTAFKVSPDFRSLPSSPRRTDLRSLLASRLRNRQPRTQRP